MYAQIAIDYTVAQGHKENFARLCIGNTRVEPVRGYRYFPESD